MPSEAEKGTAREEPAKSTAEIQGWPMFATPYWDALAPFKGSLPDDIVAFGTSVVSFSQKRLSHNVQAATQLIGCKSLEDAMAIQRSWFDTAAEDYRQDGADLLRAAGELYAEIAKLPTQSVNAVHDAQTSARKR